jgi:hypothetical protein
MRGRGLGQVLQALFRSWVLKRVLKSHRLINTSQCNNRVSEPSDVPISGH